MYVFFDGISPILYSISQDPEIFVKTIIKIHEKFSQFIQDIFLNDSIFVDAFNQVCFCCLFFSSILFSIIPIFTSINRYKTVLGL
jgi:hypothetical protein